VRFVGEYADRTTVDGLRWGVEPICRVLTEHGTPIAPGTFYDARDRTPARAVRDEQLKTEITRVWQGNYGVYGARTVWLALTREGIGVARCTVERLMRAFGLEGARRGTRRRTTVADPAAARPADLVARRFSPARPEALGPRQGTRPARAADDRHRPGRVLRRPAQSLAARHEREHQRSAAAVLPQGHRPVAMDR
jgi:putative transposase